MSFLRHLDITRLVRQLRFEGVSMHRRLALYIISVLVLLMSMVLLLLSLFGILNPAGRQIEESLETQLSQYAREVQRDYDRIAAYAISFAEQVEVQVQDYLSENGLTFDALENNVQALTELQCVLYDTVYLNMQLAPSSGAFYILDTTVNSETEEPYYSGIYLKYININSQSTVNNDFSLYRGSFVAGSSNGITFHSGWQNEMKTDFFETCDAVFGTGAYYALSSAVAIPETWENARYVYVPLHDLKGGIIGVCGFEINDLFFQLAYKTSDDRFGPIVCALLDGKQGDYSGQFSSGRFTVSHTGQSSFSITENRDTLVFDFGTETCIGKSQQVQLGGDVFSAAVMLTQAQYDSFVSRGQQKFSIILVIAAVFSYACCVFVSNRYVSPILKKIEQIKANEELGDSLRIREIDDLFAFLAEKDVHYAQQLAELEKAKVHAEEEAQRARAAYDRALEEYQLAQSELGHLSDEKKQEIVLEDYEYFICNLKTLTPTEYRIYELYLAGKTAKEIMALTGIKENTLKYHNRNIYSKLGVSSRKQLLRFAALKQHRDDHERRE